MLFQSAAGIAHLGAALHKLQSEADALWAPRKAGARAYYQAQENFEAAQAAFKRATLRARGRQSRDFQAGQRKTRPPKRSQVLLVGWTALCFTPSILAGPTKRSALLMRRVLPDRQ